MASKLLKQMHIFVCTNSITNIKLIWAFYSEIWQKRDKVSWPQQMRGNISTHLLFACVNVERVPVWGKCVAFLSTSSALSILPVGWTSIMKISKRVLVWHGLAQLRNGQTLVSAWCRSVDNSEWSSWYKFEGYATEMRELGCGFYRQGAGGEERPGHTWKATATGEGLVSCLVS